MVANNESTESFIREQVARIRSRHACDLLFEDFRVRVVTSSPELMERLRAYYAPFVFDFERPHVEITAFETPPVELGDGLTIEPAAHPGGKPKNAYIDLPDGRIVHKVRTGMVFAFGSGHNLAVGPCLENFNQVANFIDGRHMSWRVSAGCHLLHASGVCRDNVGLAIAGPSGVGKSTVALRLLERGFRFVSNDRLIVDDALPKLRMYGLPKAPRVNPGTLLHHPKLHTLLSDEARARYANMAPNELWHVEEKFDIDLARFFGPGSHVLLARLSAIILLAREPDREELLIKRIDLDGHPEAVQNLAKTPGVFHRGERPATNDGTMLSWYQKALSSTPIYEIRFGSDLAAVENYCLELARRQARCVTCG